MSYANLDQDLGQTRVVASKPPPEGAILKNSLRVAGKHRYLILERQRHVIEEPDTE